MFLWKRQLKHFPNKEELKNDFTSFVDNLKTKIDDKRGSILLQRLGNPEKKIYTKAKKLEKSTLDEDLTEAVNAFKNFKRAYDYMEEELTEEEKPILLEFCTWCCINGEFKGFLPTVELLWKLWIKETTPEDKFKIVKTKTLRSTTAVEGTLVQVTGGQWYAVTRVMPPRSPWYTRGCIATSTGRLSMEMSDMVFMKSHAAKPSVEEAIELLMSILNGAESIKDLPTYR